MGQKPKPEPLDDKEFSSVPPEDRPTKTERALNRRAGDKSAPPPQVVTWFEEEWSEEAIVTRSEKARAGLPPPPPLPSGYEPVPFAPGSRLVYSHGSSLFARLFKCVEGLIEAGIPTGAREKARQTHAERIKYVHRLLADPDLPHPGHPYQGNVWTEDEMDLPREWAYAQLQDNTRGKWHELVEWALDELEGARPARAVEAAPASQLDLLALEGRSESARVAVLRQALVDFLSTADLHATRADGGRVADGTEGAWLLRDSLGSLVSAAERVVRARVGGGDLFATPSTSDPAWSAARRVLFATGRGAGRSVPGGTTWDLEWSDLGPSLGPGELVPSYVLDALRRALALLPQPAPLNLDSLPTRAPLREKLDAFAVYLPMLRTSQRELTAWNRALTLAADLCGELIDATAAMSAHGKDAAAFELAHLAAYRIAGKGWGESIDPQDLRALEDLRAALTEEKPTAVVDVKALAAELRDALNAGAARKGETAIPDLPVRGKLQEAVLDVLAAEDGSVPLSAAEIAGKNPCKGKDPKSINRAVAALRINGWADVLETTDAGHRLLPSKRHLLPERWRSERSGM